MKRKKLTLFSTFLLLGLSLYACSVNVDGNTSISDDTTPKLRETILFPRKYVAKHVNIPHIATGNLAVASVILPQSANDKHSLQKYRGGFSKKNSLLRYSVIKSFELNMSFDIET